MLRRLPPVIQAFAIVFVLLVAGLVASRWSPPGVADALHRIVLWVCVPASVLRHAAGLRLDVQLATIALVPWVLLGITALAVLAACRIFEIDRERRAVLLVCAPLGNTSFLGYPMTRALIGDDAVPFAVIYDQLGSFLMVSTWALWMIARSAGGKPASARDMLGRLLRFPPLVALVVALTVMPASPPAVLARLLEGASAALLPIAAFAVGLTMQLRLPPEERRALAVGLVAKLLLMPAAALGIVHALGMSAVPAAAVVLQSAMPPMITASALAIAANLGRPLAAAMVGVGTIASLATLPLWRAVVG